MIDEYALEKAVVVWAEQKGIFDKPDINAQFVKLAEEMGEVAECIAKGKTKEMKMELGDMNVVLILLAHMNGHTLQGCLTEAYRKIVGRSGKMVDGVFIRDE